MNLYENMDPQKRFQLALDVQGGGNMRAIARAFVAVVDAVTASFTTQLQSGAIQLSFCS